jgi:hypothetical protein
MWSTHSLTHTPTHVLRSNLGKDEEGLGKTKIQFERTCLSVKKGDNNIHEFILRNFSTFKIKFKTCNNKLLVGQFITLTKFQDIF